MHDTIITNHSSSRRRNYSLLVKITIVSALVILFITLIHVFSLHSQITQQHHASSTSSTSSPHANPTMSSILHFPFLSSSSAIHHQQQHDDDENNKRRESYQEYSHRALSSFPTGSTLPQMRRHEMQFKPVESEALKVHQLYLGDDDTNRDSKNNNNDGKDDQNNEDDAQKKQNNKNRRRRSLDVRSIVQNINQHVLVDQGGRKTPDIVGNPVAANNNNKNNNQPNNKLRVFQVQPLLTQSLEWIPEFVKTNKGNIVFVDKSGKKNSVVWTVVEHGEEEEEEEDQKQKDGTSSSSIRMLKLQNIGMSKEVKSFLSLSSKETIITAQQKSLREAIDLARFKMASIVGMTTNCLTRGNVISVAASFLKKEKRDVANAVRNEIENVVLRTMPVHQEENNNKKDHVNNDDDDEDSDHATTTKQIQKGDVLAVIVVPLSTSSLTHRRLGQKNAAAADNGLISYLRKPDLSAIEPQMSVYHALMREMKKEGWFDGVEEGEEQEDVVLKFLIVCVVAR